VAGEVPRLRILGRAEMNDVTQLAINLARNTGWPVFPCGQNKRPACDHGFKDSSTDADAIRRLFAGVRDPLIGVACGAVSGIDLLDIDIKHEAARAWLAQAEARLPVSRAYRSRSGGVHILFMHAPGVRNSQSRLARGVDTRGDGGYLIHWGAMGCEYLDHAPPADWPEWLLQTLLRPESAAARPRLAGGRRRPGRPVDGAEFAKRLYTRAIDRVAHAAEGHRRGVLLREAFTIGGVMDRLDVSEIDVINALVNAAIEIAGGEDRRIATATARDAIRAGRASPIGRTA
jgi:hypothetical protein